MGSTRDDVIDPFDLAWKRFADRMKRWRLQHVADELIHHSAEAALLRDLYAGAGEGRCMDMHSTV